MEDEDDSDEGPLLVLVGVLMLATLTMVAIMLALLYVRV